MKTIFTRLVGCVLPLFFIVISFSVSAQGHSKAEIKPDPRLYNCFTKEYINELISNPRLLLYYNYYLDHSYFVTDNKPEKPVPGDDISRVPLADNGTGSEKGFYSEDVSKFDVRTFNPLKYEFKTDANYYTSYKLGDTGKAIVFYSQKKFAEMYNAYLKTFNLD